MKGRIKKENLNLRFNILIVLVYLVGIILIVSLFNLQIVNGASYRETSNTRLTRQSTLEATRGEILDRSGNVLATTYMTFNLELYKTKVDNDVLNNSILNLINLLDEYQNSYSDDFPISINPFEFKISGDTLVNWKKKYKLNENATAEEAFYYFKDKYKIKNDNIEEVRKIIIIRYRITTNGYSSTKSLTVAENVSREVIAKISEKSSDFPGISITTESTRKYNYGNLASHIIGYIGKISQSEYEQNKEEYKNNDYVGKTGIEYLFEKYLKGTDGEEQIYMSVDGTVTGEETTQEAVGGSSVVLTIDANLQKIAEDALKNNIEKIKSGGFPLTYDVKGGCVVAMNVKTGEVLAMASYPDYDPNSWVGGISVSEYNQIKENNALFNKAISGSYAPGSIFKMVTAIAGLQEGYISTTDKINDTGVYPKYTNPVCWYYTDHHRGHGYLNVSDAIKKSCNYFFYEIGERMGIDNIAKYAKYFGLGSKTGIELPSETTGTLASTETKKQIKNGESWYPGETLSAAIGQSYNSFSPIQMCKYISMIANGGKVVNPTIIKSVINTDTTEVSTEEIESYVNSKLGLSNEQNEQIEIAPEYIQAVLEGMRSVTEEVGGTAYTVFKDFDIPVGGKTGSAEAGNNVNAWFACFAPYDNPEIAVVVLVENGGHGYYTGEVAKEIMREYFGMNTGEVTEDQTARSYMEIIQ